MVMAAENMAPLGWPVETGRRSRASNHLSVQRDARMVSHRSNRQSATVDQEAVRGVPWAAVSAVKQQRPHLLCQSPLNS